MELPLQAPARQAPARPAYLDGLNPEQRAAVEAGDGPLLVLAGAGTGKTRVLTTRLAHLMVTGRAYPGQILAVTFTNKAAREMGERVERLIGRGVQGMWLGTFHAIGVRMLRRARRAGGPQAELHHPRHGRPGAAGQAGHPGRRPRRAALAAARAERDHPALEGPRLAPGPGAGLGGRRLRARARRRALRRLPGAAAGAERLRLRRPAAAQPHAARQQPGRAGPLPAPVPRRSWSTSTRTPTSPSTSGCACSPSQHKNITCVGDDDQSIYCWRGCRGRQHPALRAGLPGGHDHPPRAQLPLDRPHPGRRLGRDRAQPRPPRQDALDRGRGRRAGPGRGPVGRPGGGPLRRRRDRGLAARGRAADARPPSWCGPASRPARSRSASSRSACPTG